MLTQVIEYLPHSCHDPRARPNVIPGRVKFSIDLRNSSTAQAA